MYNFTEMLSTDQERMTYFPNFGHDKNFSQKRTPSQYCVYPCKFCVKIHAKNQKKVMSQS